MIVVVWFTLLLTMILMLISVVDIREQRIPDALNLALMLGGALFWYTNDFDYLVPQLGGAVFVALALWLIRYAHLRITGRIGLGLGDVKMGGAAAVWISPLSLPLFLFISSFCGLVFALTKGDAVAQKRIAFGPFLGLGLMSSWLMENLP